MQCIGCTLQFKGFYLLYVSLFVHIITVYCPEVICTAYLSRIFDAISRACLQLHLPLAEQLHLSGIQGIHHEEYRPRFDIYASLVCDCMDSEAPDRSIAHNVHAYI